MCCARVVNLFESRPDSRNHNIYQGKSINIALSDRGWLALAAVGIEAEIKQHAIDGTITEQAYGQKDQTIWSVSRSGINEQLLDLAEQEIMQKIMQISNIEKCWQPDFVYEKLWQLAQAHLALAILI